MDQTHIHLLITHLPIFGSVLGALVLGYGIWQKSNTTKMSAYLLFVVSAIGAGIAYLTGEGAEETVENIPGVSELVMEQHEEFAMFALISLLILGVAALVSLYVTYKKSPLLKSSSLITLVLSIISFALVARTGYLGGQIRHTEIASGNVPTNSEQGGGEEGDDD